MARIISIVLLGLLALGRGAGGVVLAVRGPSAADSDLVGPNTTRALGAGLVLVGMLAVAAAYGLLKKRTWAFAAAIAAPLVFVVDGGLNGYLLFGRPGAGGTVVNLIAAVLIVGFVWWARRRGELWGPPPAE